MMINVLEQHKGVKVNALVSKTYLSLQIQGYKLLPQQTHSGITFTWIYLLGIRCAIHKDLMGVGSCDSVNVNLLLKSHLEEGASQISLNYFRFVRNMM